MHKSWALLSERAVVSRPRQYNFKVKEQVITHNNANCFDDLEPRLSRSCTPTPESEIHNFFFGHKNIHFLNDRSPRSSEVCL